MAIGGIAGAKLGSYTPTIVKHLPSISQMIDRVDEADFDPAITAVSADDFSQSFVPAREIALYFSGGDVRVTGTRPARRWLSFPAR
jgi:hypothetical protein